MGLNLTIKTVNNQTTFINTSFETVIDLIHAINQTDLNNEILNYLLINMTDYSQQILNNTENIINNTVQISNDLEYHIGYNESNQSVKSLLLMLWRNVTGYRDPYITLTTEAPDVVIKNFDWWVYTRISNEYNDTQTDAQFYCYCETDLLGNLSMIYDGGLGKFKNITTATTTGLMNFTVKCFEN